MCDAAVLHRRGEICKVVKEMPKGSSHS